MDSISLEHDPAQHNFGNDHSVEVDDLRILHDELGVHPSDIHVGFFSNDDMSAIVDDIANPFSNELGGGSLDDNDQGMLFKNQQHKP